MHTKHGAPLAVTVNDACNGAHLRSGEVELSEAAMYEVLGNFRGGEGYTNFSFREPERWDSMKLGGQDTRVADTPISSTALLMGDEETGPALLFLRLKPGITPPNAPAHGHASDTWRMSLLGTLPMGPDSYDAGEFRFQQGWKPYATDNYAHGPEGGWTALLFADRRGMRVRHVGAKDEVPTPLDLALAEWLGIKGDLTSDDPATAPGPSILATTLDETRTGARINGSFLDRSGWTELPVGRLAAASIGTSASGSVVLLAGVEPSEPALSSCTFASDVFRMVVRGSYTLDGETYVAGDMRVQEAGTPIGEATAGPDGLDEVIVVADAAAAVPSAAGDPTWADAIAEVVRAVPAPPAPRRQA